MMQEEQLALTMAKTLYDKKAKDIVVLRVGHLTILTDYLVIANGYNALQVRALTDYLDEKMMEMGLSPRRVDGRADANWVAMDYQSVIVHIFRPQERDFFRLDRLWDDGNNRVQLPFIPSQGDDED